ncbi:hypothetical protein [Streptomyces pratensis]|uniref:hypothetical protein n=1 Tax=Streptomyces pratensis TaxID=1169025 RepID=UPI001931CA6F|nr:hypothetical protein [Streptomyces pratensis]
MTFLALLSMTSVLLACSLVCVLSIVYLWSPDRARRTRAWRLLRTLLGAAVRHRAEG